MADSALPHDHGSRLNELIAKAPGVITFTDAADIFSQLSDATRLRILWILCHSEECVTNIAAAIGMSEPAVSHHLRILKKTGLAVSRREGKEVYYKLGNDEQSILVHKMIDDIFEMDCFTK